jgi:hypothetical protein
MNHYPRTSKCRPGNPLPCNPAFLARRGLAVPFLALSIAGPAAQETALYLNDFEKADVGSVPDDFLVLDGNFVVKKDVGNKFLELPGAPLDTFVVLFGPKATEGLRVDARVFTTNQGRKYSAFAVGLNGVAGYRLQVSPAKRLMELYQSDDLIASMPHAWEPGTWTRLCLRVVKTQETEWRIEGKAWPDGQAEPADWMISHSVASQPFSGQASIWGKPFAGTPIRYDDLRVSKSN